MINGNNDGLVQDCSNSFVNALDLQQSCTEPWLGYLFEI